MPRLNNAKELTELRQSLQAQAEEKQARELAITVGMGTCGLAAGAGETYQAIQRELQKHSIEVTLRSVGCIGMCVKEPLVDIQCPGQPRITYGNILAGRVPRLIQEHVLQGQVVQDWAIGILPPDW